MCSQWKGSSQHASKKRIGRDGTGCKFLVRVHEVIQCGLENRRVAEADEQDTDHGPTAKYCVNSRSEP